MYQYLGNHVGNRDPECNYEINQNCVHSAPLWADDELSNCLII